MSKGGMVMKQSLVLFLLLLLPVFLTGCRAKPSDPEPGSALAASLAAGVQEPGIGAAAADAGSIEQFEWESIEVKPQNIPSYGIAFRLPKGWTYEVGGTGDPVVEIRPEEAGPEGGIILKYSEHFGVCGTGLEQRDILFNGHPAWQGFYDGSPVWSFIALKDPEYCVILNSAGDWFKEYKEEISRILSTVEFVYYGEESGIFAPDVKQSEPGTVSPAYVLDGVADWARSRLGFSKVGRYDMGTLFDTGRAKEYILDYEALMFDDGTPMDPRLPNGVTGWIADYLSSRK